MLLAACLRARRQSTRDQVALQLHPGGLGERAGGFLQRQAVLADLDEMVKQLGSMLVEDARASCGYDLAGISPGEAVQIAAGFAAGNWPPDAGRLPWVTSAYPG